MTRRQFERQIFRYFRALQSQAFDTGHKENLWAVFKQKKEQELERFVNFLIKEKVSHGKQEQDQ